MTTSLKLTVNPSVQEKFNGYPDQAKKQLMRLRALILASAESTAGLTSLEETLKWGEPSYLTKHGSTIRMNWSAKRPEYFALYFQCTSSLVSTFRTLYPQQLNFEGNRAILFPIDTTALPEAAIKHCLTLALTYHKVKHLPLLGA